MEGVRFREEDRGNNEGTKMEGGIEGVRWSEESGY